MATFRSNKELGTAFEQEMVELLADRGYWVHFIVPDARGAQPFDIIAVRNGKAIAVECKTLEGKKRSFSVDRLEENQHMAFRKWISCHNGEPYIAVKHDEHIYAISYTVLVNCKRVRLCDAICLK